MKFGIFIPNYGKFASKKTIDLVATNAEKMEFDSIWVSDHIIISKKLANLFGSIYEAVSTLAYLAGKVENIILGTSIVVLPIRDPTLFAKQIATIDQFTDNEIYLGLGVGWHKEEFDYLKRDFINRGKIMDDNIIQLKNLFSSSNIKDEKNEEYFFSPIPKRKGGPPILIGGNSDKAVKRAAKLADGWHPYRLTSKEIERKLKILQKYSIHKKATIPRINLSFKAGEKVNISGKDATFRQLIEEFEALSNLGINHIVVDFPVEQEPEKYVESMKKLKSFISSF